MKAETSTPTYDQHIYLKKTQFKHIYMSHSDDPVATFQELLEQPKAFEFTAISYRRYKDL